MSKLKESAPRWFTIHLGELFSPTLRQNTREYSKYSLRFFLDWKKILHQAKQRPILGQTLKIIISAIVIALLTSCAHKQPHIEQAIYRAPPAVLTSPGRERTKPNTQTDKPTQTPQALTASPAQTPDAETDLISGIINGMTLEEQVAQIFIIRLSANAQKPGTEPEDFVARTKTGGYVLFTEHISTVEETRALTDAIKEMSKTPPFICIDEEGGAVSRLYSAGLPGYTKKASARKIGQSDDTAQAYETALSIGETLVSLGINVNFAPVADVLTNPDNTAIGSRAFGIDAQTVSDMALAFQAGLHDAGIMTAPKHFPGHGGTTQDSHTETASITAGEDTLRSTQHPVFQHLIDGGAEFIMAGHITAPQIQDGSVPATLSSYFLTDVLRGELGFDGIIITDAMDMGAITKHYSPAEAAIASIKAGADIILMPDDYSSALTGVIEAVESGAITRERIDESLTRIIKAKLKAGLFSP